MGIIFDPNHFAYQDKLKLQLKENIKKAKIENKNYVTINQRNKEQQKIKKQYPKLTAEERQRMINCCGGKK